MAYSLDSTAIRSPHTFNESNNTQVAQVRTLSGAISRDYFGSNKRVWTLSYRNTNKTDFDTIDTIYQNYLSTNAAVPFATTETNYTVSATVHVDLQQRGFSIRGEDYLSDFDLVLTEA